MPNRLDREHAPGPPGASLDDAPGALANASQSDWWMTGVVYQIYPRSFGDTNGDGLGDLSGIIAHLDHLNGGPDSLGIDAIWLSPVYPSPDFDFGYDVADYLGIDPRFGLLADFQRLVAAAHERGIRVILDLVLNHTSYLHPWFQASRSDPGGPFGDWYLWRDPAPGSGPRRRRRPNNWRSFFGGPGWAWDETRGQFYFHTFLAEQPDLNWRNPEVREAILDVVRVWLDRGVDGFRLDVFNTFFKDAALRANPRRAGTDPWNRQRHLYDRDQPELTEFLAELRAIVDERSGRMTVGELFDGSARDAIRYVAPRHLVFDWALMGVPWDAAAFGRAIAAREAVFGSARWPANALSNHDQPRHASRFDVPGSGVGGLGDARAKVAAAALLTMRGTPFLYYGEEIGQRNISVPRADAFDPFVRRADPEREIFNRDECRGPIAWSGEPPGFGFSAGTSWLPMSPDAAARNVAAQQADPDSMLAWYRRLLAFRRATPALHRGGQVPIDAGDVDVLAYLRDAGAGPRIVVALNFADRPAHLVSLPSGGTGTWRVGLSTHGRESGAELAGSVTLAPLEALIAVEA
ncbi:MAG TPA: alpha-amylase family glycosyl hydrolase [Candidatus Limnocylindrales bacterium]|nr:alpha-amylase family glycosyl hydrolase [Candidatus Limnocylindrales bacterium]